MSNTASSNVKGRRWTNQELINAVEEIKGGTMSYRKASHHYNVPVSTLKLKVSGWKGRSSTFDLSGKSGRGIVIPASEEEKLANYLKIMSKWGFGLGKNEVLDVVQEYVQKNEIKNPFKNGRPGRNWFKSFCQRHHLSMKKPEILESSRARQSNDPFVIKDFYKQLKSIMVELGIEDKPEHVSNCDESGFRSDPTTSKVVTAKGLPAKRVTAGNARKTTTILVCVNAVGQKLAPLILHKGKNIWDSMMGENAFPNTSYAVSENGWMTEKIFTCWFKHHFLPNLKYKPALLIYDGHLSHISIDLIQTAIENQVTILKLPPHTSHLLQPLDVCVFKGVKSNWENKLAEWARKNYGKMLPKSEFANILGSVWTAVKAETITKGFEKCGIFPFNDSKISDQSFDPEKLKKYNMSILPASVSISTQVSEPINEPGTSGQISIEIPVQNVANLDTFESLLLKTVTPVPNPAPVNKKRRVKEAEIITQENYLKKLQEIDRKKQLDKEKKAENKLKKVTAKKNKPEVAKSPLKKNKPGKKASKENLPN